MSKRQQLERLLEIEKLKEREKDLEILKEEAEQNLVSLILMLKECKEKRQRLE